MTTCIPRVDGLSTDPRVWGVTLYLTLYGSIISQEGNQWINRRLIKIKDNSIRQEKTYM